MVVHILQNFLINSGSTVTWIYEEPILFDNLLHLPLPSESWDVSFSVPRSCSRDIWNVSSTRSARPPVTQSCPSDWLQTDRPSVNFINILRVAFTLVDPRKHKKYSLVISIFLHFWDVQAYKLYVERWWNWALVTYIGVKINDFIYYILYLWKKIMKQINYSNEL